MAHQTGSDPGGWFQGDAAEVHVTRVDVPFLDLTWFFVKASLAMAVAFSVTSWLWVIIGTGMIALSAGLLLVLGVPGWFATTPRAMAPPTHAPSVSTTVVPLPRTAPVAEAPAAAVIDGELSEEEEDVEGTEGDLPEEVAEPGDPNTAATEAMLREELERARRQREGR